MNRVVEMPCVRALLSHPIGCWLQAPLHSCGEIGKILHSYSRLSVLGIQDDPDQALRSFIHIFSPVKNMECSHKYSTDSFFEALGYSGLGGIELVYSAWWC